MPPVRFQNGDESAALLKVDYAQSLSADFRAREIALVHSGKQINRTAYELGISAGCLHDWLKQDRIDRGKITGTTTREFPGPRAARGRIRELETEPAIIGRVNAFG